MIYVPRGIQYVEAFKFESWSKNERDAKRVGMKPVPQEAQGRCDCGRPLSDHALLNNQLVCPGLYVMYSGNMVSSVLRENDFLNAYRPLNEGAVDAKIVTDTKEKNAKKEK